MSPAWKYLYSAVFAVLSLSYLSGRLLENRLPSGITDILVFVGALYLGFMVYQVIIYLSSDILFKLFCTSPAPIALRTVFYGNLIVSIIMVLVGYHNEWDTQVRHYEVKINKPAGQLRELNVVMASDLHLGTIIRNSRVEHLVSLINGQKPDIVLLVGDLVDEDLQPVVKLNLASELENIRSKYGIYAVTGNHEYIGGAEKAVHYLESKGIRFLRDSSVLIDSSFYLVGREDMSLNFHGKKRKQIADIIKTDDKARPILLMDHQPFAINEAMENGIDLSVSGHTHHGQLWPFNYITDAVYEISRGYKEKGNTFCLVSSGFGTWGPPMRTNSKSEILDIKLKFRN